MIGRILAHYEITEKLGQGGMGEVYRARDTRLDRDVALKLLPLDLATDPERLARFQREAKLLASLSHANIAAIHGIEQAEGKHFLVMELAEGEDLAERLRRGPIPLEECLEIAAQIALGLEEAHEKGIVHRDLKPANIKVTGEGKVKILDFGLARAYTGETGEDSDLQNSPTITAAMTQQGTILGTAAYMSPEQARGRPLDARSDIWSFGAVLFEMLTGRQLFDGDTVSDVLAAVLRQDLDPQTLPTGTPPWLAHLLARCLERDRRLRLRDVGEARIALETRGNSTGFYSALPVDEGEVPAPRSSRYRLLLTTTLVLLLAVIAMAARLWLFPGPEPELLRASVLPPEGTTFALQGRQPGVPALSPDGTQLAVVARDESGHIQIWLRNLDEDHYRPLAGTDGASYPFWSPDNRNLGFFAEGQLKRIEIDGGAPLSLCEAPFGKGGSWSREGEILFAPSYNTPIHRVSAQGGESRPVTELRRDLNQNSHRHPQWLPDAEHFLFYIRASDTSPEGSSAIYVGSLADKTMRRLLPSMGHGIYAHGHLLFVRDQTLMVQDFDAARAELRGEAHPLIPSIETLDAAVRTMCSIAEDGRMVFHENTMTSARQLVWYDWEGNQLETLGNPGIYYTPNLSPDRSLLAVGIEDPRSSNRDIWIFDLRRKLSSRFTFSPGVESSAVWSPDGRGLAYALIRPEGSALMYKALGGSQDAQVLLELDQPAEPTSWSPDGRFLLYSTEDSDIYLLDLESHSSTTFLATEFAEFAPVFSPDGKWVAYHSSESGIFEIYLTDFPQRQRKIQVSTEGGLYPRWIDDKNLLFVTIENDVMSVSLSREGGGVVVDTPQPRFSIPTATDSEFLVDDDRLLIYTIFGKPPLTTLSVVSDWRRLLDG